MKLAIGIHYLKKLYHECFPMNKHFYSNHENFPPQMFCCIWYVPIRKVFLNLVTYTNLVDKTDEYPYLLAIHTKFDEPIMYVHARMLQECCKLARKRTFSM